MESKFEVEIQHILRIERDLMCDISLAPVSDCQYLGEVLVELSLKVLVAWLTPKRSPKAWKLTPSEG